MMNDDRIHEILASAGKRVDRERARDLESYVPTADPARTDRLAAAVLAHVREQKSERAARARRVVRFSARTKIASFASAIAMAAALALWIGTARAPEVIDLPEYALSLSGAAASSRGLAEAPRANGPRVLSRAGEFELVVRPKEAPRGPIEARGYLMIAGELREWAAPIRVSSEGAISIAGNVGELFPPAIDAAEIVIVVSRAGRSPSKHDVAVGLESGAMAGSRLHRQRVTFAE